MVSTVPKSDLVIALPYLGKLSLQIYPRINGMMKINIPYCNIQFAFQTNCKISIFFIFKNWVPSFLCSGIVYKYQCSDCNATYYGKTKRHFKVTICEYMGISTLFGKRVMMILLLKKIFYSAVTPLILKILQFSQPRTKVLKLP